MGKTAGGGGRRGHSRGCLTSLGPSCPGKADCSTEALCRDTAGPLGVGDQSLSVGPPPLLQFAFGIVCLGRQLRHLGLSDTEELDYNDGISSHLIQMYQRLGDTVARQYGGSEVRSGRAWSTALSCIS